MQFDLDPVREVLALLIEHDMPAGDQKQPPAALEEKGTGIGQRPLPFESADAGGSKENGFDHRCFACSWRWVAAVIRFQKENEPACNDEDGSRFPH